MDIKELHKLRAHYDNNEITDWELSYYILRAILEGAISSFTQCRDIIPMKLRDKMLKDIAVMEDNNYIDPNPCVRYDISDEAKIERATRLMPIYKAIFQEIKDYFDGASRKTDE